MSLPPELYLCKRRDRLNLQVDLIAVCPLVGRGQVEDWRHAPQVQPIRCSLCSLGVPQRVNRPLVSSPRLVKPIALIPSSGFICCTFKV